MKLMKDRHHVCGPVMGEIDRYRVRFPQVIVGCAVGYLDISSGTCECILCHYHSSKVPIDLSPTGTQLYPVVEGVDGSFSTGKHALIQISSVLSEDVCLSWNCLLHQISCTLRGRHETYIEGREMASATVRLRRVTA